VTEEMRRTGELMTHLKLINGTEKAVVGVVEAPLPCVCGTFVHLEWPKTIYEITSNE
jgi:hypothetical protein